MTGRLRLVDKATAFADPLAEFADYEGLRRALVAIKNFRNISFVNLDDITGAPSGYYSRVLGPRPQKRMSVNSLVWVLGGLGVKCLIVEDPEALARIRSRMIERNISQVRHRSQPDFARNGDMR